jgi:hypothetical protein
MFEILIRDDDIIATWSHLSVASPTRTRWSYMYLVIGCAAAEADIYRGWWYGIIVSTSTAIHGKKNPQARLI